MKRAADEDSAAKNALKAANNTLKIQVEDLEIKSQAANKAKSQLQAQLDAAKSAVLDEQAARKKLQEQYKNK